MLFYLAGLTCNEDTGAQKGGFLNTAGKEGIAVVFPDTSPRGAGVEGEDDDWQLGTGTSVFLICLRVGCVRTKMRLYGLLYGRMMGGADERRWFLLERYG